MTTNLDCLEKIKWLDHGVCRGMNPAIFFPANGDFEGLQYALSICSSCPVKAACLEENILEKEGVWGGTTGKARAEIRKNSTIVLECRWCFKHFERITPNNIFCGDECRSKARTLSKSKYKANKEIYDQR